MVRGPCTSLGHRQRFIKPVFVVFLIVTSFFITIHILPSSYLSHWTIYDSVKYSHMVNTTSLNDTLTISENVELFRLKNDILDTPSDNASSNVLTSTQTKVPEMAVEISQLKSTEGKNSHSTTEKDKISSDVPFQLVIPTTPTLLKKTTQKITSSQRTDPQDGSINVTNVIRTQSENQPSNAILAITQTKASDNIPKVISPSQSSADSSRAQTESPEKSLNPTEKSKTPTDVPRHKVLTTPKATPQSTSSHETSNKTSEEDACNFPVQDPTHPVIMKHFRIVPDIECKPKLPSLVYLNRITNTLEINATKAAILNVRLDYCKYVSLGLGDNSDCIVEHTFTSNNFNSSIHLPIEHAHLVISCFFEGKTVAETYMSIIREKPPVEESSKEKYQKHVEKNSPRETLSVLLVGFDGTSRQNFIRSMPKTRRYILTEMDAIEMYKFNKVGDNTFPNVMAMLSGNSEDDVLKYWAYRKPMDELEDIMLWREYSQAGYRTAMLLDSVKITSFHYAKRGWMTTPWDYYFRPLVIELKDREDKHCIGDTPEVTFQMDYWLQLTSLFNNTKTKPYFAYSFNQRIPHNDPNKATMADKIFLEFFQTIHQRNVLNNTLLVFFSDHGARFGPIRQSHPGILESRTPMIFFMFPPWFRTKYPEAIRTLRYNQRRLTTMFDVHATLKDLLYFKGDAGGKGNLDTRGISLFKEIPHERLCHHAGIPIEYCMCSTISNAEVDADLVKSIAEAVGNEVRRKTGQYRQMCQRLELVEIRSVMRILGDIRCASCSYFGVTVKMAPGSGLYEATVQKDGDNGHPRVTGAVIRLNMYKGQADCMPHGKLKAFCMCDNVK